MKKMFNIINTCAVIIVILFAIDVYFTATNRRNILTSLNTESTYEKVKIHNKNCGIVVRKGANKSLVTYKLLNDRWVTHEFWNNELITITGDSDTTKIANVEQNN